MRKHKSDPVPGAELFEARKYSEAELKDFHQKIQRFWLEPRTLEDGTVAQKFDWDALAVSFGACRWVPGANGGRHLMANSERYAALVNLWDQYRDFRSKRDWVEERKNEELEMMALSAKTF